MARQPVYLLLDTSGSMFGEPIQAVSEGVEAIQSELIRDPQMRELVHLGVITFASEARQVTPLSPIAQFQPPTLEASGMTDLGGALLLLCRTVDQERIHTNQEGQEADYRPIVFILTDGMPNTETTEKGIEAFHKLRWSNAVSLVVANNPDESQACLNEMEKVTPEHVLILEQVDGAKIKSFFKWIAGSIRNSSRASQRGQAAAPPQDAQGTAPAASNIDQSMDALPPLTAGVRMN